MVMKRQAASSLVLRATAVFGLVLSLSTAGCARASSPAAAKGAPQEAAVVVSGAPVQTDRALVVTVDLGVTVADVTEASQALRDEVERSGGYVADGSSSGTGDDRVARLDLRVPAGKVRALRGVVAGLGEVTTDSERVEDVTEQRADLKARLSNARAQERRIVELLGQKASTLAEVLEAERELARIRESIERMEAQETTLDRKVSLATVHVNFATRGTPAWQSPIASVRRAGSFGWRAGATLAVYAAMAMAAAGPTLVPIAAVLLALVFVVRRRRAKATPLLLG